MWPFSRKKPEVETRAASGYTAEVIAARQQFFSGSRGVAEATAVVESAAGLWERAFTASDVSEAHRATLSPMLLALIGRSLAVRGQFVGLVDSSGPVIEIVPAIDWDLKTRQGRPVGYRLQIPEVGGGFQVNALAAEVVDIRINADPATPWHGQSPLRKARLSADLLAEIETGLCEVFAGGWGNLILPTPQLSDVQRDSLEAKLKGKHGGLTVVESQRVLSGQAPTPGLADWGVSGELTPDLRLMDIPKHWQAVKDGILGAYGIPPILFTSDTQSAAMREAQRHAVLWTLQPIAKLANAELSLKLGGEVKLDLTTPLQASDAAGRARAVGILVGNGMSLEDALKLVAWGDQA